MKLGMFRFNIVVNLKIFKIFNVFLFYYLIFVLDLNVFINEKNFKYSGFKLWNYDDESWLLIYFFILNLFLFFYIINI